MEALKELEEERTAGGSTVEAAPKRAKVRCVCASMCMNVCARECCACAWIPVRSRAFECLCMRELGCGRCGCEQSPRSVVLSPARPPACLPACLTACPHLCVIEMCLEMCLEICLDLSPCISIYVSMCLNAHLRACLPFRYAPCVPPVCPLCASCVPPVCVCVPPAHARQPELFWKEVLSVPPCAPVCMRRRRRRRRRTLLHNAH